MKELPPIDLNFPVKGLNVSTAVNAQPPGTTPVARNVRSYVSRTGRDQGGQRPGLTKYMTAAAVSSTCPIQEITAAVASAPAPIPGPTAIPLDTGFLFLTPAGVAGSSFQTGSLILWSAAFDSNGNMYGILADGNPTYIDGSHNPTTYRRVSYDKNGNKRWEQDGLTADPDVTDPYGPNGPLALGGGYLWLAAQNANASCTAIFQIDPATGNTIPRIGFPYHYYTTNAIDAVQGVNPLSYCNGVLAIGYQTWNSDGHTLTVPLDLRDCTTGVVTSKAISDFFGSNQVSILDLDNDGTNFYGVARNKTSGVNTSPIAAKLFKITPTGTILWSVALGNKYAQSLFYDQQARNIVVGYSQTDSGQTYTLATFNTLNGAKLATNNTLASVNSIRGGGNGTYIASSRGSSTSSTSLLSGIGAAAALWTYSGASSAVAQYAYAAVPGAPALNANTSPLSPRALQLLAVACGTVVLFDTTGPTSISGGAGALSGSASVIFSSQVGTTVIFVDGVSYQVYDTTLNTVAALVASAGTLPVDSLGNTARLCCEWRNRFVVSGLYNDPRNWFMSALGDPTNWSYNPNPAVETEAVAGNQHIAGECPDVVTALIPYSDEILLLGGSKSIFQMVGDPAAGGRIDLVSSVVGIAWGRAFCRDGQGLLYFLSHHGSVYRFAPGGLPERISDPVSSLLLTTDLGSNLCRMAWDERHYGFHLWITPTTAAATLHYFHDVRTGAWFQDQHANTNHDPLAVYVLDGDATGGRVILMGGRDGIIRKIDVAALDDDGTPINSQVLLGPVKDKAGNFLTLADLQCSLDATSGPVKWSIQPGADAQTALAAASVLSGTFAGGKNRSQAVRVGAQCSWVRLASQNVAGSAWQLENVTIRVRPSGPSRQRMW